MIARHDRCGTQPSAKGDGEKLRCCLIPFASGVRCVPINLFLTIRSLQSFWPKTDRSINRNRQLKRQRGAWGHFKGDTPCRTREIVHFLRPVPFPFLLQADKMPPKFVSDGHLERDSASVKKSDDFTCRTKIFLSWTFKLPR